MPNFNWILEQIDSESPGDINISLGATEATLFFIIDAADLNKAYYDLLGWCKISTKVWPNQQVGGLERQIPMSHPRLPMLYCDAVEIVGVSVNGNQRSNDFAAPSLEYANQIYQSALGAPKAVNYTTQEYFAVYKQYRIAAHFKAVPYFVLTDEQMVPAIGGNNIAASPKEYNYWVRDNNRIVGYTQKSYYDFREYLRMCTINIIPQNEVIANTSGRTYWHTSKPGEIKSPYPAPFAESPLAQQNSPTNFQNITKNKVEITWYKVPKLTITNPMYVECQGMINYGPNFNDDPGEIDIWNYEFFNFAPGTLLYSGLTYKNSQNPFPIIPFSGASELDLILNPLRNQYIDITFTFWQFIQPKDLIVYPDLELIDNYECGKMYSVGWNMVPAPNRLFYYVESTSADKAEYGQPPYYSTSFQRFFDPLAS